jgi:hypothetical protein
LHARWMRDDLADSGVPSPYTSEAATRQIIALARESIKQHRAPDTLASPSIK